jgi:acyl dehydratase
MSTHAGAEQQVRYFDHLAPGEEFRYGPYHVTREELLEFNTRWDPLPVHTHDEAARAWGFKGITASGQYTLCVRQKLISGVPWAGAVIGAIGFDELRFPHPVYPGDSICLSIECLEMRPSKSRPERGIITFKVRLTNQDETTVLSHLDTVILARQLSGVAMLT